jgi:CRP/FNR family transcriptional regulator, dissimilatory nitrate respiration regulator
LIYIKSGQRIPPIIASVNPNPTALSQNVSGNSNERFLAGLPLFAGMGDADVRRLARFATEVRVPRDTVIFRQGEGCGGLHFVVEGQIKLTLQNALGDEKVIDLLGPGSSFGETALFLGEPHREVAEAIADSVLVQLGRDAVLEETRRNAGFSGRALEAVCRRLVQRTRDLESVTLHSGPQRVTAYLLSQFPAAVNGAPFNIRLPAKKSIIASRLNLTQEHFSRILHEIQAAGLIEVIGREIRIIDAGRLHAYPG